MDTSQAKQHNCWARYQAHCTVDKAPSVDQISSLGIREDLWASSRTSLQDRQLSLVGRTGFSLTSSYSRPSSVQTMVLDSVALLSRAAVHTLLLIPTILDSNRGILVLQDLLVKHGTCLVQAMEDRIILLKR